MEILGLQLSFRGDLEVIQWSYSGDSAEIQRRFSGDSAVHTTINQKIEFCVGGGGIRNLEIGVMVVLLGDRDSNSDINDGGSRMLMEIIEGAI